VVGGGEVVAVEGKARALEVVEAAWDAAGETNPVLARAATAFARSAVIACPTRLDSVVSTGSARSAGQRWSGNKGMPRFAGQGMIHGTIS
jgi:hypothetical protein